MIICKKYNRKMLAFIAFVGHLDKIVMELAKKNCYSSTGMLNLSSKY